MLESFNFNICQYLLLFLSVTSEKNNNILKMD